MLEMLQACGLWAHPDKYIFRAEFIENLEHNFITFSISPHHAKVAASVALQPPKNISKWRTQLGFINYYRCYMPMMSQLLADLKRLPPKGKPWVSGPAQQAAHNGTREAFNWDGLVLFSIEYDKHDSSHGLLQRRPRCSARSAQRGRQLEHMHLHQPHF